MAVQTFYIISGFYMSLILQENYLHYYRLFITNRILRIYPLYLLVLVMTILVYGSFFRLPDVLLLQPLTQNISCTHWLFSAFLIFSNVFILGQDLASWADIPVELCRDCVAAIAVVDHDPVSNRGDHAQAPAVLRLLVVVALDLRRRARAPVIRDRKGDHLR